jgi:hypothetical protein
LTVRRRGAVALDPIATMRLERVISLQPEIHKKPTLVLTEH